MMIPGHFPTLALLLALAAAPVHAQDTEECPKLERWRPSLEELQTKLRDHKGWVDKAGWWNPAVSGRAVLCNADLGGAQLQGAHLNRAQLQDANLYEAHLQGANLSGAQLQDANLDKAQLQGAILLRAHLQGANLAEVDLVDRI